MSSEPIETYPYNPIYMHPVSHNAHPNTSFRPVFIVLAIITTLSAISCVAGRFCSKWHRVEVRRPIKESNGRTGSRNNGLGLKMWEARMNQLRGNNNSDIEFGFDRKNSFVPPPTAKPATDNGGTKDKRQEKEKEKEKGKGKGKGKKPPHVNVGFKPQVRFAEDHH